MPHTYSDRCLALAGLLQAVTLVQSLARLGRADADDIETAIHSLLTIDAGSTAEIYGGVVRVRHGLQAIVDRLGGRPQKKDLESTRYAIALLHLERKLMRSPPLLTRLREGIQRAIEQAAHFGPSHPNVIAALGSLYQETVSTLQPRILVQGDPALLSQPDRQSEIRTLLLAGMRSAVLWDQLGGRRWQLLLQRRRLLEAAQSLLDTIEE
ncbi:high frequency lysogenization protein HflD [Thiohalobacter sp. IOR34]|uniref:high frequency lysogenization protein HflD n=1 Tax=Thiohalobacter sp. IOR34 TaxID=3057176 RepID=UPI0025AF655B|nr:high frequency lysogenization protein HflD [Thiohalobacter sp. IOR34]WJW74400.1 high frequency lysogenization protein HflD [Thiohalobacter sp. IOR34]